MYLQGVTPAPCKSLQCPYNILNVHKQGPDRAGGDPQFGGGAEAAPVGGAAATERGGAQEEEPPQAGEPKEARQHLGSDQKRYVV